MYEDVTLGQYFSNLSLPELIPECEKIIKTNLCVLRGKAVLKNHIKYQYACQHGRGDAKAKKSTRAKKTGCELKVTIFDINNPGPKCSPAELRCLSTGYTKLIRIENEHNHEVDSLHALSFKKLDRNSIQEIDSKLEYGQTPAQIKKFFENQIHAMNGNKCLVESLADRSLNPTARDIHYRNEKLVQDKFGPTNGVHMFEKLYSKCQQIGAKYCEFSEKEPLIVLIVTGLMKKIVHASQEYVNSMLFIDSTCSLEQFNLSVFTISIYSPAKSMPIGN